MILIDLFIEFFKIGLFAIGGGAATIPFLFDLTNIYPWYSAQELTNMIAVAESSPGPIGVNMATFAGFKAGGVSGAITATLGLVTPSVIIIIALSKILKTLSCNLWFKNLMLSVRPAVLALISFAFAEILTLSVNSLFTFGIFFGLTILIYFYKASPIFYMLLSALIGIIFKL